MRTTDNNIVIVKAPTATPELVAKWERLELKLAKKLKASNFSRAAWDNIHRAERVARRLGCLTETNVWD